MINNVAIEILKNAKELTDREIVKEAIDVVGRIDLDSIRKEDINSLIEQFKMMLKLPDATTSVKTGIYTCIEIAENYRNAIGNANVSFDESKADYD